MKIRDLLRQKPPPVTIRKSRSIQLAMRRLIDNKIGSLVVVDKNSDPIGIITERDIFHLAFRFRGDMMDMKVGDNITGKLVVGSPDDGIDQVAEVLTSNRIRHLPIINDKDKLCGIISKGDIIRAKTGHELVESEESEKHS